jgi:hypothetical protein
MNARLLFVMLLIISDSSFLISQVPGTMPMFLPRVIRDPTFSANWEIELEVGSIAALEDFNKVNVVFDHKHKIVCDFGTETAFLEHIRDSQSKKKADKMIANWQSLPDSMIAPRFVKYFNKSLAPLGITAAHNDTLNSDVTLLITVFKEEPHYHSSKPPYVKLSCVFQDEYGNHITRFRIRSAGSRNPDMGERVTECYGTAGKMLANEISKELRKLKKREKQRLEKRSEDR